MKMATEACTTTQGVVRYLKEMQIGLTGTVTEKDGELFLKNKRLEDLFRELLGRFVNLQIRYSIHRKHKRGSYCQHNVSWVLVEDGGKLFFEIGGGIENGGSRKSIKDIFQRFIGEEIDIDIKDIPKLWLLLPEPLSGCCCDD